MLIFQRRNVCFWHNADKRQSYVHYERTAEAKLLSFAGQGVPTKLGNIQETYLLNPVNLSAKTKEQFFTIRSVSCS